MTHLGPGSSEAAQKRTGAGVVLCAVLLACSLCIGCLGAATGTLKLSSTPEGAMVYIDGAWKGTTPVLLDVTEGTHRIELRMDGYEDWSHTAVIGAGKT
ncbi:MAG: PEGA domain-containing protein, partial [Methanomicrobiales archaeon]|nr:PEGA domain-containing protein [Methanomicrobiales archaeon]